MQMLFRACLLLLCSNTQSLSVGSTWSTRSIAARAGTVRSSDAAVQQPPAGLSLDTLTEESALALEGDALATLATELSVSLFRIPPFQEKAEQPKRRLLALVYAKLGSMGKAESCAREAAKVDPGDLSMLLLLGKCEEARAEPSLAKATYERAARLESESGGGGEAAAGLGRAIEALAARGGLPTEPEQVAEPVAKPVVKLVAELLAEPVAEAGVGGGAAAKLTGAYAKGLTPWQLLNGPCRPLTRE